jgi:hypothetical protein
MPGHERGRWPEAEPYLMKVPGLAHWYAQDIIKGRWEESEPYIMKNSYWAYRYAVDVMKKRWPEAEEYIKQNTFRENEWGKYKKEFNINE